MSRDRGMAEAVCHDHLLKSSFFAATRSSSFQQSHAGIGVVRAPNEGPCPSARRCVSMTLFAQRACWSGVASLAELTENVGQSQFVHQAGAGLAVDRRAVSQRQFAAPQKMSTVPCSLPSVSLKIPVITAEVAPTPVTAPLAISGRYAAN